MASCTRLASPLVAILLSVLLVFLALVYLLESTGHSAGSLRLSLSHPPVALREPGSIDGSNILAQQQQQQEEEEDHHAANLEIRLPANKDAEHVFTIGEKMAPRTSQQLNGKSSKDHGDKARMPKSSPRPKHPPPSKKKSNDKNKNDKNDKNDKKNNKKGGKGQRNKYWTPVVLQKDPDWGYHGELPYIEMIPTPRKIMIKKDRKVVFPNVTIPIPRRDESVDSADIIAHTLQQLRAHFLHTHPEYRTGDHLLEDVMQRLQQHSSCGGSPLFLTMATVGDELYWQLIENFVYTLAKFDLAACALVICVSDPKCMSLCADASFPCYDFQSEAFPSVMEKIAMLKLLFVPRALRLGVDVFMLDLDVGFLADPKYILQAFHATPSVDIFVQEDYTFIMNRSVAGWKSWFTEPLPNIGAFLCRGNNRTHRVFEIARDKYLAMDDAHEKANPGKDQNHVLEAMRIGRGTFGLKYAYLGNNSAPLLDKLVLFNGPRFELGGELTQDLLFEKQSLLVHTTCYEKSTKVMGLKATNAYWNPFYYLPGRRTLTCQLLFQDDRQLLDEARALLWLASLTGRALVLPNLLGDTHKPGYKLRHRGLDLYPGFRLLHLKRPGERFRALFTSSSSASSSSSSAAAAPPLSPILEPGFYWRTQRDYGRVPAAEVVFFGRRQRLVDILHTLRAWDASPRIILHGSDLLLAEQQQQQAGGGAAAPSDEMRAKVDELRDWADDSVGRFAAPYAHLRRSYIALPSVREVKYAAHGDVQARAMAEDLLYSLRTCKNIFHPPSGNRSCFQICD